MTKVFLSYSHDSDKHCQHVLELSDRLRDDGIDCSIDQYNNGAPPEGWQRWMELQVEDADFVLLVCTQIYLRRFKGEDIRGGRGVNFEGVIISQLLYDNFQRNTKFIPIITEDGSLADIPLMFKGGNSYKLHSEYEQLYRVLTDQPLNITRPLGKLKHYPPANKKLDEPINRTVTKTKKINNDAIKKEHSYSGIPKNEKNFTNYVKSILSSKILGGIAAIFTIVGVISAIYFAIKPTGINDTSSSLPRDTVEVKILREKEESITSGTLSGTITVAHNYCKNKKGRNRTVKITLLNSSINPKDFKICESFKIDNVVGIKNQTIHFTAVSGDLKDSGEFRLWKDPRNVILLR